MMNRAVMLAGAVTALVSAALFLGCGDAGDRRLVSRCARGGGLVYAIATHGELVCEDADGTAYASRAIRKDETPDTACAFCLGRVAP